MNKRQINFVKEGSTSNSKNKPYSILGSAPDWTILMDTYEKHYKIPEDVGVSSSRPDIFLFSRATKRIVLVELTVPWETNIPKDHVMKQNKYYDLQNELTKNGYVVNLYAVEVGARGIPAKSLYNLLKDLGLSRSAVSSILERVSKAALVGSYRIWLGRERNTSSEVRMSLLLKSVWRNVLRGGCLSRNITPRSLCSTLSELTRPKAPDPVTSSLRGAAGEGGAGALLAAVQAHLPQMTQHHMLQALRCLFEMHKAGELHVDAESLHKDPVFSLLCRNFKKCARELEVNEAIEATKVLSYLKVPVESLIVQTLLQILRCNINQLNVRHIMFLDFLLGRFDKRNHLVDALKLALPLAFQIHLPMELDREDLPLLKDMLVYATSRDLPDRIVNNIVTGLLLHDQVIDAQTAKSIIWSLCLVNCTETKFPTRVQLLHICYDILTLKMDHLSYDDVLRTAAKIKGRVLEKHPEYYQEQLMDAVAEYAVVNQLEFEKGLLISRVLSRIAHTHLGLVARLCAQAAESPGMLSNARINVLFGFINCLANNNYTPAPEQWKFIRQQISENHILDGKNFALPWTKLCLELASLGHYEDKLLTRVFSEEFLQEYLAREDSLLDHLQLLTLFEAVKAFHSQEYSLPAEVLAKAKALYPVNKHSGLLEESVGRALGGNEFVVKNVTLPCGINADLVTCLKGGYPIVISRPPAPDKIPLEELELPRDSIIVCLINFNAGCFSMNSNRLRGTFRLLLDVLEAQGFAPVPINVSEWLRAPAHERSPYLMREIGYKCGEMGMKLAGT